MMLPSEDALLSRKAVAQALTAAGLPITVSTLATKACRGDGPPYRVFGRSTVYRWGDALAWAKARLSAPAPNAAAHKLAA